MEGDGEGRREEGWKEGGKGGGEEERRSKGKREITREKLMERGRGVSFKMGKRGREGRKK